MRLFSTPPQPSVQTLSYLPSDSMALFEVVKVGRETVRIYTIQNRGNDFWKLTYQWSGEWVSKLLRNKGAAADERAARALAREIATAISQGRADHIPDVTSGLRTLKAAEDALSDMSVEVDAACREYAAAYHILRDTGGTLIHAAEKYRDGQPQKVLPIEVHDAVEKYLAALEADGVGIRHMQDSRSRLRRFSDDFRGQLLHEIRTAEMLTWLRGLKVAPRTRNNYTERIVAHSHWAQTEGHLRKDAPTEADGLKVLAVATNVHIFSVDDFRRLIYGAVEHDPRCIHYLAIGVLAFVRPAEMDRMRDTNVRFEHNDIEVADAQAKRTRKKGHRRLVPMQPNLRAWLEEFPLPKGKLVMAKAHLFVRRLARQLGIEWHPDVMRHSGISYAVALTQNVDQVALWAGNTRQIIYSNYLNQVTPAEAAEFYGIMPPVQDKKIIAFNG